MTVLRMQKASLLHAPPVVHGKIAKQTVTLGGVTATRVTFAAGARWSTELSQKAGSATCQARHVAFVQSGVLRIQMDDGAVEDFGPGDVMILPSGHDAWTLGAEPCVFVEFSRGYDDLASTGAPGLPGARLA